MQTVKLNMALKEKNRLKSEIGKLQSRVADNNVWREGTTPKYDARAEAEKLTDTINSLVRLKTKIFLASNPIREKIERSAQLKAYIAFLKGLDCDDSAVKDFSYDVENRARGVNVKRHAALDRIVIDSTIDASEKAIRSLQDEIDEFNGMTDI